MAKDRYFTDTKTGEQVQLAPYLYPHHTNPKQWRYMSPHTNSVVNIFNFLDTPKQPLTVHDANDIAHALNQKYGREEENKLTGRNSSLVAYAEKFIKHEIDRRKEANKHTTNKFKVEQNYVRKFAQHLGHYRTDLINTQIISDWWHNKGEFCGDKYHKTAHSQHNQKRILFLFIAYLINQQAIKLPANPFNHHGDAPLQYTKANDKYRRRLTLEQFVKIKQLAQADGCLWLVNAMDLSLMTGMRKSDVINLQWDKHFVDNKIRIAFQKSVAQLGETRAVHIRINLKEHEGVREVINRAMQTRNSTIKRINTVQNRKKVKKREDLAAFHVIHNADNYMTLAGGRTHYSQITKDQLSRKFAYYRDQLPELAELDDKAKPTFHEIRALYVHINKKRGVDIETIQKNVGHQTSKMTEGYASGHETQWEELTAPINEEVLAQHLQQEAG